MRAGDTVRVRSRQDIFRTLDQSGRLDGLPFMPEMLRFCGQTLEVVKRADKTCDSIRAPGMRRMEGAVFLSGSRCDGSAHGQCEARCLLFWKEAWLEPLGRAHRAEQEEATSAAPVATGGPASTCTIAVLREATTPGSADGQPIYMCQATELRQATSPLPASDLSQYVRDITSGNVRIRHALSVFATRLVAKLAHLRDGRRQTMPTRVDMPHGPAEFRPGDRVRVRKRGEIEATLDAKGHKRGLSFSDEMVRYCGGEFRVLGPVERIVNERTGHVVTLRDCLILDGVACRGDYHRFCPRSIYAYWREAWLEKLD